ncbi:unnamed protein product, partial [Rodentolepis nana]|uniref:Homeobox domain-containing protein n=1 Tax=Rodentolepis nana TaxID=102285 RepID=A0A0R3U0V2_RODNA
MHHVETVLSKNSADVCVWFEEKVNKTASKNNCKDLDKNSEKDQLDYTFDYKRTEDDDSFTTFT